MIKIQSKNINKFESSKILFEITNNIRINESWYFLTNNDEIHLSILNEDEYAKFISVLINPTVYYDKIDISTFDIYIYIEDLIYVDRLCDFLKDKNANYKFTKEE